jgi:hypothetical protein
MGWLFSVISDVEQSIEVVFGEVVDEGARRSRKHSAHD